jgi:hypothetical protein
MVSVYALYSSPPLYLRLLLVLYHIFYLLSDAECREKKPLEFGYDVITTCRLEIGTEDFEDCDIVR